MRVNLTQHHHFLPYGPPEGTGPGTQEDRGRISWTSDKKDYHKQLYLETIQKPDPYNSPLNSNYFAEQAAKELIILTSYLKC